MGVRAFSDYQTEVQAPVLLVFSYQYICPYWHYI